MSRDVRHDVKDTILSNFNTVGNVVGVRPCSATRGHVHKVAGVEMGPSLLIWGRRMTSLSKERAEERDTHHEGEWLWKTEGLCLHLLNYVICKVPSLSLSKISLLSERSLNLQWINKCYTYQHRNHPAWAGIQFTTSGTEKTEEFRTGNEWCHYAQFQLHRNFGRQIVNTQSRTGSWGY